MGRHKKFDEIYPYTYIIIDNKTNNMYYGVRWGNIKRKTSPIKDIGVVYFTSSKYVENDFRENTSNYTIKIHFTFDTKEEAIEYESKILSKILGKNNWINKTDNHAILNTDEEIKKISARMNNYRKENPLTGENHPMFGKKHSNETKKIISTKAKDRYKNGFKHPLEGIGHTDSARKKMSNARKGKTLEELIGKDAAERSIEARRIKTIERNKKNNPMKNKANAEKVKKANEIHYTAIDTDGNEVFTVIGNSNFISSMRQLGFSTEKARLFSKEKKIDNIYTLIKKRYPASGGVLLV